MLFPAADRVLAGVIRGQHKRGGTGYLLDLHCNSDSLKHDDPVVRYAHRCGKFHAIVNNEFCADVLPFEVRFEIKVWMIGQGLNNEGIG